MIFIKKKSDEERGSDQIVWIVSTAYESDSRSLLKIIDLYLQSSNTNNQYNVPAKCDTATIFGRRATNHTKGVPVAAGRSRGITTCCRNPTLI